MIQVLLTIVLAIFIVGAVAGFFTRDALDD